MVRLLLAREDRWVVSAKAKKDFKLEKRKQLLVFWNGEEHDRFSESGAD